MSTDSSPPSLIDRILREHGEMVRYIHELEVWLDVDPSDLDTWASTLHERMDKVTTRLRSHFTREENGALHQEIPATMPRFAETLTRLLDEHRILDEDMAYILEAAAGGMDRDKAYKLARRARLFIARLRRHESEENEILQYALYGDDDDA